MVKGWRLTSARAMNFSASPHEHRIGARRSGRKKPAGSGHALAIIVPTAIVPPAVASAMLVPKLIADAGENTSRLLSPPTSATRTLAPLTPSPSAPLAAVKRKCGEERYVIILDFCATPLLIPQLFFNHLGTLEGTLR